MAPPPYEEAVGLRQPEESVRDKSTPPQEDCHTFEQDVTPVREVSFPSVSPIPCLMAHPQHTPPSHSKTPPLAEEKGVEAGRCDAPQPPQVNLSPNEPEIPPKPTVPAKIESVNAFSAFSGSSSPFASYSNTSGASPFAPSGLITRTAPAWKRDDDSGSDVFGRANVVDALAPSPNGTATQATTRFSILPTSKDSVGDSSEAQSFIKSSTCKCRGGDSVTVCAQVMHRFDRRRRGNRRGGAQGCETLH